MVTTPSRRPSWLIISNSSVAPGEMVRPTAHMCLVRAASMQWQVCLWHPLIMRSLDCNGSRTNRIMRAVLPPLAWKAGKPAREAQFLEGSMAWASPTTLTSPSELSSLHSMSTRCLPSSSTVLPVTVT